MLKEDDSNWPAPDRVGRQELEVVLGNDHVSFATTKLGSLLQVRRRQCCYAACTVVAAVVCKVVLGNDHVSFATTKLGSLLQVGAAKVGQPSLPWTVGTSLLPPSTWARCFVAGPDPCLPAHAWQQ